jgi:hypothetical protein
VYTILLVSEDELTDHDVTRIAQLHGDEKVDVHLLVPADTKHNKLIEALDEIALGKLRDALEDSGEATPEVAEQEAMHAVNHSIDALQTVGITAKGSITGDDPVPAAVEAAKQYDVDEVIVVTPPHLVKETLHRDWASRLRDKLELPVLHAVSGTDRLVR